MLPKLLYYMQNL